MNYELRSRNLDLMGLVRLSLWVVILICPLLARAAGGPEEERLIATLQSAASPREKEAACSQLKRIGTVQSLPALAALLTDETFSHFARYALESMQAPEAGAALLAALPKTSGSNEVGIINSLAARHEMAAITPLGSLLSDPNVDVAVASSEALGRIGGENALAMLEAAPPNSADAVDEARIDAQLAIANELLTHGEEGVARKTFQRLFDTEKKEKIRVAAFRGLILSSGEDGVKLLSDGIASSDDARQGAALQLAASLQGADVTKALAALLGQNQPPVQIALLRCLAQRGDAEAMASAASLADSPDSDVRVAAITALGDLGDGSVALLLAQKAAATTGAERNAARESLLDLRRGSVTGTLVEAIAKADAKVRLELLRAIGGRGDKSAIPKLVELARGEDDSVRAASCQALASLAGASQIPNLIQLVVDAKTDDARSEATEALSVVYQRIQSQDGHADASPLASAVSTAPLEARVSLLSVCAGLNEAPTRDALRAAINDQNSQVREAAVSAVCETHDAEMLPDLIQLARESKEQKFRRLAIGGCVRLATQEDKVVLPLDEKLRCFKTIIDTPLDAAERRMILSGLAVIADDRALTIALPFLDDPAVRPEAVRAVLQIASAISNAQPEPAGAALKKVLEVSADPSAQKAAQAGLDRIQEMSTYVTDWKIAGPYMQAGKNFAALFDIPFPPESSVNEAIPGDGAVHWQDIPKGTDPAQPWKMDLLKALGGEQRVAYARTWIYSPGDRPARLLLGADDGVKVWFDGRLVHANNASRALQPDSDKVDVTLHQGWNPLLLKVTQNTAGWSFCLRVTGLDGAPIAGARASAIPHG
jgi:HEAT repeat protein